MADRARMIVAACRSVYEYLQPRGSLPGCVHDRRAPVSVSVCPRARCAPRTRPSCVTSSHRRGAASGPRRAPILIDRARLRLRGAWWWSCCTCASSGGWRRTSGRRGGWRSWPGRPACVEWRPYPGRGGGGTGHAEMEVVARRRQAAEPGAGAVVPARRQARTTSRRTFQDTSHVHGMGDRSLPTGACFMCSAHSERGCHKPPRNYWWPTACSAGAALQSTRARTVVQLEKLYGFRRDCRKGKLIASSPDDAPVT
jgi:hypothetical protein